MPEPGKHIRILMADDDPEERMMVQQALAQRSVKDDLILVEDGRELMDYLRHRGKYADASLFPLPGLILLDLHMPHQGGREALAELKSDRALRRIPVVVFTTSKSEQDILRAYDQGANAYITKPGSFQELVKTVRVLKEFWIDLVELPNGHSEDDSRAGVGWPPPPAQQSPASPVASIDLAGRRRLEQERESLLTDYRLLLDSVPACIWYKDTENRILRANVAAARAMGKTVPELEGKSTYELYPEEAAQYHRDDLEVINSGLPKMAILEPLTLGSGEKAWVQTDKVPYRDERGEVTGVVVFSVDVTDRVRAQEQVWRLNRDLEQRVTERTAQLEAAAKTLVERARELALANKKLARSNAELEQFASIASHDLQEPLRKVQTFGDLLANTVGSSLGETGRLYVDRMQDAARRMKGLIQDLLALARVSSRDEPFAPIDLAEVAREVVSDLEGRLQSTGGKVEIDALPRVESDRLQMRQLLQNLLGNALKFHRPGVPPVVHVHSRLFPAERILSPSTLQSGEAMCEIMVEDNGIGIEKEFLEWIFAPFQRLHGRGQYEGTGMGLAICRKIVERHGGTIRARSKVGEGSTFVITLPLRHAR